MVGETTDMVELIAGHTYGTWRPQKNWKKPLFVTKAEGVDQIFFSTSGTEANEAAVKVLRQYMAPKYKVISRYHSYHGSTATSISLTGDPRRWYAERARSTVPGVVFAPLCATINCRKCNILNAARAQVQV